MKTQLPVSLALFAASCNATGPQTSQPPAPLYFFVFGDSYTASGFNTTGAQPSLAQPFGNPLLGPSPDAPLDNPQLTNLTSANGPIWAQYLTTNHNATPTLTYDFAVSGASIPDGFTVEVLNNYEPQYAALNADGGNCPDAALPGCGWTANTSIVASWIGINDINWCSSLFATNKSTEYYRDCLPPRVDTYFELMSNLYRTGLRRFFFVNLPPLERAPMVFENGNDTVSNYADAVALYNDELLPRHVDDFQKDHEGVQAVLFDVHTPFGKILDHPTFYGFRDNKCYGCIGCTNGTEAGCFWANNYHPVTQVHERLAADMVANLTTVGWPASEAGSE